MSLRRAGDWLAHARGATLPPLRFPPPAPLFPHQQFGARRLVSLLTRYGGALLLDGVGMGKSFTAAAAARELHRNGWSVHLVVPAPLVPAWSGCLARFGVDAPVLTHDALGAVDQPVVQPALLVVDEAHRFRNPSTRRWRALARWSVGRALLLITATPIWNREEDLLTLLRLAFRDDAFAMKGVASIDVAFERNDERAIRSIVALAALRRTEKIESIRFPGSRRTVARYTQRRRSEIVAAIRDLEFPLLEGDPSLLRSFLMSRLDSSLPALLDSLGRQRRFCRRASESAVRGFSMRRRNFDQLFHPEDREYFQELLFPSAFLEAGTRGAVELVLLEETEKLDRLIALVGSVEDDKQKRLSVLLESESPAPAILFTRSRATAAALHRGLRSRTRCALITSAVVLDAGGERSTMQEILGQFRARSIDLLVLTDLASEGLDLQAAGTVIHYDLPWTSVKMMQRAGRARRIGQTRDGILVVCFLPERPERSVTLSYIGRKQRLENRILCADPVRSTEGDVPYAPGLIASAGARTLVAMEGVIAVLEHGCLNADPLSLRPLLDQPVEVPTNGPVTGDQTEAMPPARVMKSLRPFEFRIRVGSETVLEALAVRNRSGIELLLSEGTGAETLARLTEAIVAESCVVQRGDWNSGAPVRRSTVEL
ncbi:MAG: helicase-related protein [Thermoanaerobaculia bacterium]